MVRRPRLARGSPARRRCACVPGASSASWPPLRQVVEAARGHHVHRSIPRNALASRDGTASLKDLVRVTVAGVTAARTARHQRLSAFLASRSDVQLAELVGAPVKPFSVGVGGGSEVVDVDGVPVFTKRIPPDRPGGRQPGLHRESVRSADVLPVRYRRTRVQRVARVGRQRHRPPTPCWPARRRRFRSSTTGGYYLGRSPVADEHADIDARRYSPQGGSPAVRARLEALAAATCSLGAVL